MARRGPSIERVLTKLIKGLLKPPAKAKPRGPAPRSTGEAAIATGMRMLKGAGDYRRVADNSGVWHDEAKIYLIGLVGESNYQGAISVLRAGDAVSLMLEPGNPYDSEAIAAVATSGKTIGYIPRENWVRRALIREEKGCTARVASVRRGDRGHRGVVIEVVLEGSRPQIRRYRAEA